MNKSARKWSNMQFNTLDLKIIAVRQLRRNNCEFETVKHGYCVRNQFGSMCLGDSGGPLVYWMEQENSMYVVGVGSSIEVLKKGIRN